MKILKLLPGISIFLIYMFIKAQIDLRTATLSAELPPQDSPLLIPKIFHHIWFDFGKGKKVFSKYEKNVQKLKSLHPDWKFITWNLKDVIELIEKQAPEFLKTFMAFDKPVKKHDAARIIILKVFGGVYIDHDYDPKKNIEPLLKSYKFVVGAETESFGATNSLIASVPEFDLLNKIIAHINQPSVAQLTILECCGPKMLTKVLKKYIEEHTSEGIKVYTQNFFNPINWENKKVVAQKGKEYREKLEAECYMLQTYDSNWWSQLKK